MRILLIDHSQYITGGLPKVIEVAESLAQRGHSVTLVTTSISNKLRIESFSRDGVKHILSPSVLWGRYRNGADLWDALNRILSLRKRDFDLVHGWDCRPTVILPSLYLRLRCGYPLFLDWDDLYSPGGTVAERSGRIYQVTFGRFEEALDTRFRRFANGHIVVSQYLRNKLIEMGVDPKIIMVNHYGSKHANTSLLSIAESRQILGLPSDRFVLGYAGSMFKGDEILLYRALERLPDCVKSDMIFMAVGTKLHLNYGDIGITLLRTERLPDKDFTSYLCAANTLILPYRTTVANMARWPSKFSDYCAMGRPIISTPISDLPLIYEKYPIGIMTHGDSEAELADSIMQVYKDPIKAQEMGRQAKAYARSELILSSVAERLEQFYKLIMG